MKNLLTTISLLLLTSVIAPNAIADEYTGTLKIGYVYNDEEGNQGVYQPTYNTYEGMAVSLEGFNYRYKNGTRLFGNLKNVTLNNRHIVFGAARTNKFNLRLSHNKYRRSYSFEEDRATRRLFSNGSLWLQAHQNIRIFGGYGQINKSGQSFDLFEAVGLKQLNEFDYSQKFYNVGAKLSRDGSYLQLELRGSNFDDELGKASQRNSKMIRVTGSSPLTNLKNFYVNAGFQNYKVEISNTSDTLNSNTGWGGIRYFSRGGMQLKYSFIWDRSRRTGDLVATDKIANRVQFGKVWRSRGGLSFGYSHLINDDVRDEVKTNGYFVSTWFKPGNRVTLRGSYGSEITEVESGSTLTGDKNLTRLRGSISYKHKYGRWRAKIEDKSVENDDIGSRADFMKVGTDLTVSYEKYGELQAAYDYFEGDYQNTAGSFVFSDHVFHGDVLSKRHNNFQLGFGGTYLRSKQNLDLESFSVRFTGNYDFNGGYNLEVTYSAHNFDDFNDPSPVYNQYFTANIVKIVLAKEL
ncbi:MAG: hypothetical protein V3S17_07155 [candidate division Zixibacteria bacterium]